MNRSRKPAPPLAACDDRAVRRPWVSGIVVCAFASVAVLLCARPADANLPPGFSDHPVLKGLKAPTSVTFAPDGRVFVAEKRGTVVGFDGIEDDTPTRVADLRTAVHSYYDRGLLSIAADPAFPRHPYLYVGYTYDAPPGGTAPFWGKPGRNTDHCPGDAAATDFPGCVVRSRVSRLTLDQGGVMRREKPLLTGWCQQFLSHSIGDLAFDRRGALLVGGGEGANYVVADTGDVGAPADACGDPAGEGGALRAQDALTGGDPLGLDGTIARIDPATGAPAPGNPSAAAGNEGRIMSFGLRNPFRFALRPGTDELFVADVGWTAYEEIDVAMVGERNDFGWPCFSGPGSDPRYAATNAPICGALYADPGAVTPPWFSYMHGRPVVAGEACPSGEAGSAISGLAFDHGRSFPAPFDGALLFADYLRGCIGSIGPGRFGQPRRSSLRVLESNARFPVDLVSGPGGIYYADLIGGSIRRISYDRPTVELSLGTAPPGLRLTLDDRDERDGSAVTVRRRSRHRIIAPSRQQRGRRVLRFVRWSDGGERRHSVAPDADATFRAVYACIRHCPRHRRSGSVLSRPNP